MSRVAPSSSTRASRSGTGLGVYRQRRLVAEEVAGHCGQHEGELGMAPPVRQDVDAGIEKFLVTLGRR